MKLSTLERQPDGILCYTDSTGLPRVNEVLPMDSWPFLLLKKLGMFTPIYVRGLAGITSSEIFQMVVKDGSYLGLTENENEFTGVAILSFGIVDAAPRPITYKLAWLGNKGRVGAFIWSQLKKFLVPLRPTIQNKWSYSFTEPHDFESDLRGILKTISNPRVTKILVLTPLPSRTLEERSPGIIKAVLDFNLIKKNVASEFSDVHLVEVDSSKEGFYRSEIDGHHFSKQGHLEVAASISKVISQCL
jgi:hypothetical protein